MNVLGKTTFTSHSDFPMVLFSFLKTSSASAKTSSTGFWKLAQPASALFTLPFSALPVCHSAMSEKQYADCCKTGSTSF
jgi:hypothetical protein